MNISFAYRTHVGNVRKNNEDSFLIIKKENLAIFCVADGMGGAEKGEIASKIACDTFSELFFTNTYDNFISFATNALKTADFNIKDFATKNQILKMGTTISVLFINQNIVQWANIGDSRIYKFEKDRITQLTEDDSYVNYLIKNNFIEPAEAKKHPNKHLITNALGTESFHIQSHNVSSEHIHISEPTKFLICTDGLTNSLSDEQIAEILSHNMEIEQVSDALLNQALNFGGEDNITFIIVDIK